MKQPCGDGSVQPATMAFPQMLQDLRYTFRILRRDAGFPIRVLIAGLGIGASAALFSVVNTLLLRPLPFEKQPSWWDRANFLATLIIMATIITVAVVSLLASSTYGRARSSEQVVAGRPLARGRGAVSVHPGSSRLDAQVSPA